MKYAYLFRYPPRPSFPTRVRDATGHHHFPGASSAGLQIDTHLLSLCRLNGTHKFRGSIRPQRASPPADATRSHRRTTPHTSQSPRGISADACRLASQKRPPKPRFLTPSLARGKEGSDHPLPVVSPRSPEAARTRGGTTHAAAATSAAARADASAHARARGGARAEARAYIRGLGGGGGAAARGGSRGPLLSVSGRQGAGECWRGAWSLTLLPLRLRSRCRATQEFAAAA